MKERGKVFLIREVGAMLVLGAVVAQDLKSAVKKLGGVGPEFSFADLDSYTQSIATFRPTRKTFKLLSLVPDKGIFYQYRLFEVLVVIQ